MAVSGERTSWEMPASSSLRLSSSRRERSTPPRRRSAMSLKSSQTGLNSSSSVYSMRCVRLPSRIWCTPLVSVCSGPQMCRKMERVRKRFVSSTASSTAATTAAANMAARTFRLCASTVTTGLYILTAYPSPDSPQSSYSPSETVPVPPSAARAPSRAADSGAGTPKRAASVPLLSMMRHMLFRLHRLSSRAAVPLPPSSHSPARAVSSARVSSSSCRFTSL